MIIATCVHCGHGYIFPAPSKTPCWRIHHCRRCLKYSVDRASRIDPVSYTVTDFILLKAEDDPDLVFQILREIPEDALELKDKIIRSTFLEDYPEDVYGS